MLQATLTGVSCSKLQKILQVKRKFTFIQILMEHSNRKLDDPAKKFKPPSEEEHEFYHQLLDSICATFGEDPTNLQGFPQ